MRPRKPHLGERTMPTVIYVPYRTTDQAIDRLTYALHKERMRNPAWSNATFDFDFDDCCWIETKNEIDGARLLYEVIYPTLEEEEA